MPKENRSILHQAQMKLRLLIARRDYSEVILRSYEKRTREIQAKMNALLEEQKRLDKTFEAAPSVIDEYKGKIANQRIVVNAIVDEKTLVGFSRKSVPIYTVSRVEKLVRMKRRLARVSAEVVEDAAEEASHPSMWTGEYDVGHLRIAKKKSNAKWFWWNRGQKGQFHGPFDTDEACREDATTE